MTEALRERRFATRYDYDNPVDQQRALGLITVSLVLLFVWLVWLGAVQLPELLGGNIDPDSIVIRLFYVFGTPVAALYIIQQVNRGFVTRAGRVFVAAITLAAVSGLTTDFRVMLVMFALVSAGVMLTRTGLVLVGLIMLLMMTVAGLAAGNTLNTVVVETVLLIVTMVVLALFSGNVRRIADTLFVETRSLKYTNELAQTLRTLDYETEIFNQVLTLITKRLRYGFTQLYLRDPESNVIQRIRIGLGIERATITGEVLLEPTNAISVTLRSGERIIATREDLPGRIGHFIPSTLVAVEIPLVQGNTIIGVLDVQQATQSSFNKNQLLILEMVAQHLVTVLQHLRETRDLRREVTEQSEVAGHLRRQLSELRQSAQSEVGAAWEEYLNRRGIEALGFDLDATGGAFTPATDLPFEMRTAFQQGEIVVEKNGTEQIVSVPIQLRGETVGAMSFIVPSTQSIGERQREMAQNVAARLAQALENKRLVEQTQEQAEREHKANEAASLLLSSTDLNTVLDLAADAFNRALGAVHTRIYLKPGEFSETRAAPTVSEED